MGVNNEADGKIVLEIDTGFTLGKMIGNMDEIVVIVEVGLKVGIPLETPVGLEAGNSVD